MYHVLFFKLSKDDIFHHIYFVLFLSISNLYNNPGYLVGVYTFFVNGLPGGIDYLMLFLMELKLLSKKTRLQVATFLNVWIRCPGMLMVSSYLIIFYLNNIHRYGILDTLFSFLNIMIPYYNGLYYMKQVVEANTTYNCLNKFE